jgi:predicted DNA binding protein
MVSEACPTNPREASGLDPEAVHTELWGHISSGDVWEGEIINRRKSGELCWVDTTVAPITDGEGTVERYVAVERDVTERKERQLRIEEQNDRLERLNNTNEVIRDVNRELVAASNRREIERVLCDRFASSHLFDAAWVGTHRLVDGNVSVRTAAGVDPAAVEATLDGSSAHRDVAETVLDRRRPAFVDDGGEPVDDPVAAAGVVVPLSYQDADYGALFVEAATEGAFEAIDRSVFAELGLAVGDAINAAENRRTLASDEVTRLGFRLGGTDDPLVSLSSALGCTVELDRIGDGEEGDCTAYVSVDCEPDAVSAHAGDTAGIERAEVLCHGDERCAVRLTLDDAVVTTLARYGAAVQSLTVTEGTGRLVADIARSNDVRSAVEAVQSSYPGLDLVAQHEREPDAAAETKLRTAFEESLTDRQLEAAQTAYFAGFFEWPRDASGEEVAATMGINQSTFTQHLRAAERKLFAALLDRGDDATVGPVGA